MTSKPSAREQAKRRWIQEPQSLEEISRIEEDQAFTSALLGRLAADEDFIRTHMDSDEHLLAVAAKVRRYIEQRAAGMTPGGPSAA